MRVLCPERRGRLCLVAAPRKYSTYTRREIRRRVRDGERPAAISADLEIPAWTVSRIAKEERQLDERSDAALAAERAREQYECAVRAAQLKGWKVHFGSAGGDPVFLDPEHRVEHYEASRRESQADLCMCNDVLRGRPIKQEERATSGSRPLFRYPDGAPLPQYAA